MFCRFLCCWKGEEAISDDDVVDERNENVLTDATARKALAVGSEVEELSAGAARLLINFLRNIAH